MTKNEDTGRKEGRKEALGHASLGGSVLPQVR
jgi:hypothetical protein